jgi:DNA-binding protein HU-beta
LAPHFNGSKKEAAHAVDIVFDTITRNMSAGNDVMINDFGKFKKVDRKARMGRNPFTGETIKIKASKKARFLPAKALKEVIAGDRKLGPAPKPEVKAAPKPAAKKAAKKAPVQRRRQSRRLLRRQQRRLLQSASQQRRQQRSVNSSSLNFFKN